MNHHYITVGVLVCCLAFGASYQITELPLDGHLFTQGVECCRLDQYTEDRFSELFRKQELRLVPPRIAPNR